MHKTTLKLERMCMCKIIQQRTMHLSYIHFFISYSKFNIHYTLEKIKILSIAEMYYLSSYPYLNTCRSIGQTVHSYHRLKVKVVCIEPRCIRLKILTCFCYFDRNIWYNFIICGLSHRCPHIRTNQNTIVYNSPLIRSFLKCFCVRGIVVASLHHLTFFSRVILIIVSGER